MSAANRGYQQPPYLRPNKLSDNIFTGAANGDNKNRPRTTLAGDYEPVVKPSYHKHHHQQQQHPPQLPPQQPPQRQYLVSFREGATKPSELFGSLKKVGKKILGSNSSSALKEEEEEGEGGGKQKCQCRHHLKKLREQNKLDEQRYTRAILNANNIFNKGDQPDHAALHDSATSVALLSAVYSL